MRKTNAYNTIIVFLLSLFGLSGYSQSTSLRFEKTQNVGEYRFNTGVLKSILKKAGEKDPSLGFKILTHVPTGKKLVRARGLLNHYRMLSTNNRYGNGGVLGRPSTSRFLDNGNVETTWKATKQYPFVIKAIYSFIDASTIDVITEISTEKNIKNMEISMSSYFQPSFSDVYFYLKTDEKPNGEIAKVDRKKESDIWHMTPRDNAAWKTAKDGRYNYPKFKFDWVQLPYYKAPIAIRKSNNGFTGVIMANPKDCYAVGAPYSGEYHKSIYMSLFGFPMKKGEKHKATVRLKFFDKISNEEIINEYNSFLNIKN